MKKLTVKISLALIAVLCGASVHGAVKYWDINGATPGAGGATPGGAWTSALWSTSADGDVATGAWAANDSAVFSAGTDATGTFTVTGNATASGITVEEGKVIIGGTITLGANPVTINSGATLSANSSLRISATAGSVITLNGGTWEATNPSTAGSFVDVDQTIVLNGGGTLSYTVAGLLSIVQTTTTISGTGPLTKEGAGILAIASACSYSGATIINNGTLRIRGSSNRLPTGTVVTINPGAAFDPASLSSIVQRVGAVEGAGNVVFSASGTLVVNQTSGIRTLSGAITDGSVFGKVEKRGAGEWILGGVNTFDGTFTQIAGTTTVNSGAKLAGAGVDLVVTGGTLNLNNADQTVLSLAGDGGTINLANGHVFTVTPTANKTNASVISGLGAFVKEGTGALTLTGASDYSGGTTINAGKLVVNGSLGSGAVNVNGGTLAGSGTIGGPTVITDKIAPGTSIGTMTFDSTLSLAPTSTTLMEIDPSQAQNADLISAASISLDGVLAISQIGGTLLGGQTFNLFDGTLTGNFDSITGLPDVSADYWYWDTSELGAGGNGELQLIPEPSAAATLMLGFFGLALWRRFGRC